VRRDVLDDVNIALNSEVKPPAAVDTRLPSVFGLIVLLGAQAGMAQVLLQQRYLLKNALRTSAGACSSASKTPGT
jgi:hypothetical protein